MINLPIQLPEYWSKPQVYFVYSNGKEKPGENWQIFSIEEDMEPTVENALIVMSNVPEEFHHTITYVRFERAQPIKKVRYGQGELADDGRVYVGSLEYSIEYSCVWFVPVNSSHHAKRLEKPIIKKGLFRSANVDQLYIKETIATCIKNTGYESSLIIGKEYLILEEVKDRYRILDESGEDYLFPKDYFK